MYKTIISIFFLLTNINQLFAQNDSIKLSNIAAGENKVSSKTKKIATALSFAVPSALVTYGIITRFTPDLQNFDHKISTKVEQNIHHRYTFDDYIQFVPYIAVYGLDSCGVRAKHSFAERTLLVCTSILIMGTAVTATKQLTNIKRPDHSNSYSFPSGHTAAAFLGAHILSREYQDVSVWISIAGYACAFATGAMRIVNKKHWFSDVVTGAGVGIISAELSYLMLPVWRKWFKIRHCGSGFALAPIIFPNQFCIGGVMMF
jgi:membrane-associated phospholipid phosphatase